MKNVRNLSMGIPPGLTIDPVADGVVQQSCPSEKQKTQTASTPVPES
jgi:hypothetical protein